MALRGKKPETVSKRLKLLLFGQAGVGKTTAAIQMPRVYLVDTERGAENDQYVKALAASGGVYWHTADPDDLIAEVRSLISDTHPYQTLVIDPLTIIYNDLCEKGADAVGTDFGRYKIPADRKLRHLLALLLRLDMNVVITSHSKVKWIRAKDAKGKDTVAEDGMTFDCYGKLDYLFDLVIEVQKRGLDRLGIVRKTRIEAFPEGDIFPFTYEEIADRYGRDILERAAVPVALATPTQIAELTVLLGLRTDAEDLKAKWFKKAGAESLDEMTAEQVGHCITYLGGKPADPTIAVTPPPANSAVPTGETVATATKSSSGSLKAAPKTDRKAVTV